MVNTAVFQFLSSKDITHQKSYLYTPEQNGVIERSHIVETAIWLLFIASMPSDCWVHAFQTAVFLINRVPTQSLDGHSFFERLFGHSLDLHHLKVFGCTCFHLLQPYNSTKLDPRTTPHIFFGYPLDYTRYLCINHST